MFRGATLVNLDSKGRLAVPTRYRDGLIETLPVNWYAPLTSITRACCFTLCLNGKSSSKNYRVYRA
jgi:MraZ protein